MSSVSKSGISNFKFQISDLKSQQISNLKSPVSDLKSQISNLKSQISDLDSQGSKPIPSATAMMSPVRLLSILLSYVKPYASRALALVLTLLVEGAFNILLALSLKFIIDFAIAPRNSLVLGMILGSLGAGFLLTAGSQVIRDYLYAWLGARIVNDVRKEMFCHFLRCKRRNRLAVGKLFASAFPSVAEAATLGWRA